MNTTTPSSPRIPGAIRSLASITLAQADDDNAHNYASALGEAVMAIVMTEPGWTATRWPDDLEQTAGGLANADLSSEGYSTLNMATALATAILAPGCRTLSDLREAMTE